MKKLSILTLLTLLACLPLLFAQTPPPAPPKPAADKDKPRPIKDVLPDAKKIDGLFTFYQKKDKLYAEIKGGNLNTDYLIAIAVAKGSGSEPIGGYTLNSGGGDWLWQFRKVNDNIQVVRRNIRYKADSGTPEAKAVEVGYSDSILYSLPIVATGEGGGDVIDLASIFMSDLPKLGIGFFDRSRSTWGTVKAFPNNMEFRVAATYSGGARYLYGESASPDPSATGVTLHYSISKLPSSGYSPRIADQRIGYFTVSHTNFSRATEDDHSIRYINRWNLQKAISGAEKSAPKEPIVFWIEKTVPFKYRSAVREGILEWNKAFEKAGIINAIEVRQQGDSDTWDAEDINYNTIRWITSGVGFAMGPSRVNPMTGEILDADIIFDASWVDYWRDRFDYMIAETLPAAPGKDEKIFARGLALRNQSKEHAAHQEGEEHDCSLNGCVCNYVQEKAAHFALAALALAAEEEEEDGNKDEDKADEESNDAEDSKESQDGAKSDGENKDDENKGEAKDEDKKKDEDGEKKDDAKKEDEKKDEKKPSKQELEKKRNEKFEQLVLAGIKDVVMHEVGHTLGLRHNFQASSWLTLDEINDPNRDKEYGYAGSVMDYMPINIAPKGKPQGDYFMPTLGPYDHLAIEYGYKVLSGGTDGEKRELVKIASRQAEKGNNYATDEDLMFADLVDPRTIRYDFGKDPLTFSQWGLDMYNQLMPQILDRAIREDGRYRDVGRYYMLLVSKRFQENMFLMRNLEGLYRNRDYKGDPGNRPPIQVVDAKTKRDSVKFLCENTFGADAFKIAPELYNQFGQEKWLTSSDGVVRTSSVSLGQVISQVQCSTLEEMIAPWIVEALADTALRVPDDEDIYTVDELFSTVRDSVFSELDNIKEGEFSPRKPAIPHERRVLQELYFLAMSSYASGQFFFTPELTSTRSLAMQELKIIEMKIVAAQAQRNVKWDSSTQAHLTMLLDRIKRLREANFIVEMP